MLMGRFKKLEIAILTLVSQDVTLNGLWDYPLNEPISVREIYSEESWQEKQNHVNLTLYLLSSKTLFLWYEEQSFF